MLILFEPLPVHLLDRVTCKSSQVSLRNSWHFFSKNKRWDNDEKKKKQRFSISWVFYILIIGGLIRLFRSFDSINGNRNCHISVGFIFSRCVYANIFVKAAYLSTPLLLRTNVISKPFLIEIIFAFKILSKRLLREELKKKKYSLI